MPRPSDGALDRLGASAIRALIRPFHRPLIALFGGALMWVVLSQLIVRTVNPHLSETFTAAFNVTGGTLTTQSDFFSHATHFGHGCSCGFADPPLRTEDRRPGSN